MIHFVTSTGSTNADLLADAAAGQGVEGDWLVARRQTAGRGRLGRHWDSAEGNFHGSTLVGLADNDPPAQLLAFAVAIAVFDAVAELAPALDGLQLKWPNDLLIGSAKLGGILLERQGANVVIGVGVNLGWGPDIADRLTTSLADVGRKVSVDRFVPVLAAKLVGAIAEWRYDGGSLTREGWLARAHPIGTPLSRTDAQGNTLTGRFDGLEEDGSLRLRTPDGAALVISSGEVMLG